MEYQKLTQNQKEKIVAEYIAMDFSYIELGLKHNVNPRSVREWVKKFKGNIRLKGLPNVIPQKHDLKKLPYDIKTLREELYKARLHNQLLEELLDIGKEKYGVDLRKKTGAKQS